MMASAGGWSGSNGRVLVVADNDETGAGADMALGASGLWAPAARDGHRDEDDGLVLFEYGALGVSAEAAVRSIAASAAAVYFPAGSDDVKNR